QPLPLGEVDNANHVCCADGDVSRHAARAAVARRAVNALDQVGLHAFPDERVLAGARTDDEDLQPIPTRSCPAAGGSGGTPPQIDSSETLRANLFPLYRARRL